MITLWLLINLVYFHCSELIFKIFFTDIETGALEEKNKRDHYTQLVGACLVRIILINNSL